MLEILVNGIKKKKRKSAQMGKEDIRLFFSPDDFLQRKSERTNNKEIHLGQISNYSKVARYKINIQKSILILYTKNEQVEFEIKNTKSFIIAPSKIVRYNLENCIQDYMKKSIQSSKLYTRSI